MQAYAVIAKVNADFADREWGKKNLKEEGLADDFSTVWARPDSDVNLNNYDDAVYFYGGRNAIYKALANFESAWIRNYVPGHRADPIHVFSGVVRTIGGKKQIIMLAVADAQRDADLAAFRDQELEERNTDGKVNRMNYRMYDFRAKMKQKWPDIG
jgi:hypothetical protein